MNKRLVLGVASLLLVCGSTGCEQGLQESYVEGFREGHLRGYEEGLREGYKKGLGGGYQGGKFFFYYVPFAVQQYGVSKLEGCLGRWNWVEGAYKAGSFDCGEMSAFLEWYLENEGWNTVIVVGDTPSGSGRHAWLLVETSEEGWMPVEATQWEVVYWDSPLFDAYWDYEYKFEDIQEALSYDASGFIWWS